MSPLSSPPMRRGLKDRKRNKKGGGFFWFWNKVRGLFGLAEEGAGGVGTSSSGAAASAASRIGSESIEAGEGLGRVSVLSPGVGEAASHSSIWLGRAIMAAIGISVVAAGVIGVSKALSSSNPSSQTSPHFGPIASLIHIFRPGYGNEKSQGSSSSSSSASGSSGESHFNKAVGNATAQNLGKAQDVNAASKSGKTAVFPSAFEGLPSAKLSTDLNDGSPLSGGAAPKEAGQAAQEAALIKNGSFSANNKIAATPMSAMPQSPYLAAGVVVGNKGRGFSHSFGGLRGMSEYVHPMGTSASSCASGDSSCDSAAGNAINQWENAPIVGSGQGISMGGTNAGTADNPGTTNPTGSGGTGGSSPGTSLAGDISNICSSDQIQKGYVSNGSSCVPGYAAASPTNATPWQNNLNNANLLIEVLSASMAIGAAAIAMYWSFMFAWLSAEIAATADPFLQPLASALKAIVTFFKDYIQYLGWMAIVGGLAVIGLGVEIARQGGHSQGHAVAIVGGLLVGGGTMMAIDNASGSLQAASYSALALTSFGILMRTLL